MKRRRSLTRAEQSETLVRWMDHKHKTQRQLVDWLESRGIIVSPAYLNDVIRMRRAPGPKFKAVFRKLTGIELEDGLIEREGA
jgi:hypothetical protein